MFACMLGEDLETSNLIIEGDALFVIQAVKGEESINWKSKPLIDQERAYFAKWPT